MMKVVLFVFAAFLAVVPFSTARCNTVANQCALDGTGSTYTETVTGTTRRIVASGCPNNNPHVPCISSNPNPAAVRSWDSKIPANPKLQGASYTAALTNSKSLTTQPSVVGLARNGGAILSCYGGNKYGACTNWASSAVNVEGDTFDYCGGHGNPYHYHVPPSCLLTQIGDKADKSSPQVGWAYDGFPMYGPKGPGGVMMRQCTHAKADATYCTDKCGGQFKDIGDNFLYRYYIQGDVSDGVSNKLSPLPGEEYFPHTPLCFVGCLPSDVTGVFATASNSGFSLAACRADAISGTTTSYDASKTTFTALGVVKATKTVSACDSEQSFKSYTGGACLSCPSGCSDCSSTIPTTMSNCAPAAAPAATTAATNAAAQSGLPLALLGLSGVAALLFAQN